MEIDWEQAVEKLARITEQDEVKWVEVGLDPYESLNERRQWQVKEPVYVATVKDRSVLVYEYRYKQYTDEDEWHWENEVGISFVKDNCQLEYEWPQVAGRWQLLDVIRLKVAKAGEFIEEFLAD